MALDNLISLEFTDDELKQIDNSLDALEKTLLGKCKSLTPEQRREFSQLGDKTENWAKKTMDYMHAQPAFTPTFVDQAEAERDYAARQAIKPRYNRLAALTNLADDTLMILGSDIYHSSIAFYRNIKLLADQNVNGAKAIYDDLSAQFPGHPKAAAKTGNDSK